MLLLDMLWYSSGHSSEFYNYLPGSFWTHAGHELSDKSLCCA